MTVSPGVVKFCEVVNNVVALSDVGTDEPLLSLGIVSFSGMSVVFTSVIVEEEVDVLFDVTFGSAVVKSTVGGTVIALGAEGDIDGVRVTAVLEVVSLSVMFPIAPVVVSFVTVRLLSIVMEYIVEALEGSTTLSVVLS